MVEINEFAVFLLLCLYLVSFRSKVGVIVHYDNIPFWISADTNTWGDLE